jgi:hypothetical protein
MMADVAENEPPAQPQGPPPPEPGSGGLPALPAGSSPEPMPPGMDAEEYRRFQEFQRFQDYQRFTQGQQPQQPVQGQQPGGLAPLQPGQPTPYGIEHHLNGMQQQLAQLTEKQVQAERLNNPPIWQKILRNKWLHRLIWLVIIIVLATWGVPKLIHYYLGGGDSDSAGTNASLPLPKEDSGELPEHAHDAVYDVYMFIASDHPDEACFIFNKAAQQQFAQSVGATTCETAITKLHSQLTDAEGYNNTSLSQLPAVEGTTIVVSSCDFDVSGGPRLGTFTVTEQNKGWEITDYAAGPDPCPAPSSNTSIPPTS